MTDATRSLLEYHFDTAFAAPDGIKKLRELILTLPMQGKLVPQDPNDPPASKLLKEIEAEIQRLGQEGKIKQSKPLPPIKQEEVPSMNMPCSVMIAYQNQATIAARCLCRSRAATV
jgi:type I restriction enzyme S subunit